jgi:CheY-like chemotaxis protein
MEQIIDTAADSERPNVLVVEDEPLVAEMIKDWLDECGFAVRTVADGKQALRVLRSDAQVDALFTDINLPGELDGSALAQQARKMRPDLPVVYASGQWRAIERLPLVPESTFVPKPYDLEVVSTLLARLVKERHH